MLNNFILELNNALDFVRSQKKYVRSGKSKERLRLLYEKSWLPFSMDFRTKFGNSNFKLSKTTSNFSLALADKIINIAFLLIFLLIFFLKTLPLAGPKVTPPPRQIGERIEP